MKQLYCATMKYLNGEVEIYHLVAIDGKHVHRRLDATIEQSKKYMENYFVSYSFRKIEMVDGYTVTVCEDLKSEVENIND